MTVPLTLISFLSNDKVTAGFTYAGRDQVNKDSEIPGLNLGENTPVDPSEIKSNLNLLLNEVGADRDNLIHGNQIHSSEVKLAEQGGYYEGFDGFVTTKSDLILGIKVADCAAVLLADPVNGVIGAAHAGWRGAIAGIVETTVKTMQSSGAEVSAIRVYLSPCISKNKFEVGEEVAVQFPEEFVDNNSYQKPHIDLKGYLKNELMNLDVIEENIRVSDGCTVSNDHFYSHRREREKAGRMLGFIKLNSTP